MSLLDRLERKLGWLAVPNVTLALVFLQSLTWLLMHAKGEQMIGNFVLIKSQVAQGEWWRLFSFLLLPPTDNVLFLFFALYMFFLMGTALENHWGVFRYNLYLLIAYLATIAAAWISPAGVATNAYIGGSVFLAFAYLYPEFEILIFFILPVKVKWIALLTWLAYGWQFLMGDWLTRALVIASVLNFLLFFGKDLIQDAKSGRRRMALRAQSLSAGDEPFHRCTLCGVTDKQKPKMEFRYCPQCAGTPCYCIEHITSHAHRS